MPVPVTVQTEIATVPLGPAPEFCVADGAGKMYVNLEGSSETLEIDVAKGEVTRRVSLAPAEGPTGLAIDLKPVIWFSIRGNYCFAPSFLRFL